MENEISDDRLLQIILKLCENTSELEHVEFKKSNFSPLTTAKNISAITNAMTRRNIPRGYLIWGIDNETHEIVGTAFKPYSQKVSRGDGRGNEELYLWLSKHIKPTPRLTFRELKTIENKRIVVGILDINPSEISKFDGEAFIRIGANTRPLREFPPIEKELWSRILSQEFETLSARSSVTLEEVYELLDLDAFYRMRQNRVPVEKDLILKEAIRNGILRDNRDTTYDITNFGALLYSRNLQDFQRLSHKNIRIIRYVGTSKLTTIEEYRSRGGYLVEFDQLLSRIMGMIVKQEVIGEDGIRRTEYLYPALTIRELFVNMFLHQDLSSNTMCPMVEIYSDRIEFSNPGAPLVPQDRFIDYPPQTRNQRFAKELYNTGICEIRGSGWDKVAEETSEFGYPAPKPDVMQNVTKVRLVQQRTLMSMTNEERLWTLYSYACLLWVKNEFLTNSLVRKLFHIPDTNMSTASSLLSQAVDAKLIVIFDKEAGTRSRKYLPRYGIQG